MKVLFSPSSVLFSPHGRGALTLSELPSSSFPFADSHPSLISLSVSAAATDSGFCAFLCVLPFSRPIYRAVEGARVWVRALQAPLAVGGGEYIFNAYSPGAWCVLEGREKNRIADRLKFSAF